MSCNPDPSPASELTTSLRILLFIGELGAGGAERQFLMLAKGLASRGHSVTLVTVYPGGHYAGLIEQLGISYEPLFLRKSRSRSRRALDLMVAILRLRRLIRNTGAEVVYTALWLTNLLSWIATRDGRATLVWGVRASRMELNLVRKVPYKLGALVSRTLPLAIANSERGREDAARAGYQPRRFETVPNGVDVEIFRPDRTRRTERRKEWGVSEGAIVIGTVARFDPMKGLDVLLDGVSRVMKHLDHDMHLVCVGSGDRVLESWLKSLADQLGISDVVHWVGSQKDMTGAYNAFDLFCLASRYGEGTPNVVGEAMACGLPCVVTDVGEMPAMIGGTGRIVPPEDADALAGALEQTITNLGAIDLETIRRRVVEHYSIEHMVKSTETLLREAREFDGGKA